MNRVRAFSLVAGCAGLCAIIAACGKDDSLGNDGESPLNEKGDAGAAASQGGDTGTGGRAIPSGGRASGGTSAGGTSTGGVTGSAGGGADCNQVQCLRAIECVEECGGPVVSSGCCPCDGTSFDQLECTNGEGGAGGSAGSGNLPTGGASAGAGGSAQAGNAGAGGEPGSDDAVELTDAVTDPSTEGKGDCTGTTLGQVITAIHLANRELESITTLYDPQNPSFGRSSEIFAFATPDGFRLVFMRGSGDCPAGCINREYWYFETNAQCDPEQVGHYARGQGNGCVAVSGAPVWGFPDVGGPSNACPPPDFDELNSNCVDDACPGGLTPTFFYGLAGTAGPRFCWCTIGCSHEVDLCPDGTQCTDIGDGPQNICYAH